jgi:cob(I)alamin adenosyltransferase
MLDKLERAVTTISDNSNKIAIVLERHENRLDDSEKSDQLIIKMMEEMKVQEEKNHTLLHDRIDRIQKKVDSNQKFVIGAGAVLATLVAVGQVVAPMLRPLTPAIAPASMERLNS